jgi:hydrogenase maturation factor HypE
MATVSVVRALSAALKQCDHASMDGAAVALARNYAEAIQAAAVAADELNGLIAEDEAAASAIARLRAVFDAQQVLSDLGPKFLAALTALNMTPVARSSRGGVPVVVSPAATALAELRAKRAAAR